jgi:serine/threonine-protein kinase PknG
MEFIPGRTLKELLKERGPLPVDEAIAYMLPILEALGYLHDQKALYNDLKPENIMLKGDEQGKNPNSILIDLGAVRLATETAGGVYHTPGYSAPEIAATEASKHSPPSIASDIYTVGRTLAALIMNFRMGTVYLHSLPGSEQPEAAVLAENPSLHRWLLKCTRENPDERFQDAREAGEQLKLILLELAAARGLSRPAESTYFTGDLMGVRHSASYDGCDGISRPGPDMLPDLKMILDDPAAQFILSNGAVSDPARQEVVFNEAAAKFDKSVEALLRLARAKMHLGKYDHVPQVLERVLAIDPFEVRVLWYRGLNMLYQKQPREALAQLNWLWGELPGEPAVKLALAVAAELAGETSEAIRLYDLISAEDPRFVLASFGLGRCLANTGAREAAVAAYGRVSQEHSMYENAQAAIARALLMNKPSDPTAKELAEASRVVEALTMQGLGRLELVAEILNTSLDLVDSGKVSPDASVKVLGRGLEAQSLRVGLYETYIGVAKLETKKEAKIKLIDLANRVQPRRLIAWK